VRSGDLLRVDFGVPRGSTPALIRPAVVMTSDTTLSVFDQTFHVVPITSNDDRAWSTDVPVADDALEDPSVAQCHLLAVIDQVQVLDQLGNVGPVIVAQIRSVITDLLDLDG
jgi:mRNA interferase MazF